MNVPDPNTFGGPISLAKGGQEWHEVPLTHSDQVGRGVGVADLAYAVAAGQPTRASGELAFHVLEVMTAIERASESGAYVTITSQPDRPQAVPVEGVTVR